MSNKELDIEVLKLFSGSNEGFLEELANSIALQIDKIFDSSLPANNDLKLHYAAVQNLDDEKLLQLLQILHLNLNDFYSKYYGANWHEDKIEEMHEAGLIYLWYSDSDDNIVCFMSFMMTINDGMKVIYLYEIHVAPKLQSLKIGTYLINKLHELSKFLNSHINTPYKYSAHYKHDGVALTVFSDNSKALEWYFKLGYNFTDSSPRDRVLRSGRVIKPDIYLLMRED